MNTKLSFGEWLADLLLEKRLRQREVADRIGVAESTVSDWINGDKRPTRRSLRAVAEALGVDRDEAFVAAGYTPQLAQPSPPRRSEQEVQYRATGEDAPSYDARDPLADPRLRFWASVEGDLPPGDVEFLREMAQALVEKRKREGG
jgi:transcriptional regulator with XRE-family HTH domain